MSKSVVLKSGFTNMPKTKTLIFVRHAESLLNNWRQGNSSRPWTYITSFGDNFDPGLRDAALSREGRKQAKACGRKLAQCLSNGIIPPVELMMASPLTRALETSELIVSEIKKSNHSCRVMRMRSAKSRERTRSPNSRRHGLLQQQSTMAMSTARRSYISQPSTMKFTPTSATVFQQCQSMAASTQWSMSHSSHYDLDLQPFPQSSELLISSIPVVIEQPRHDQKQYTITVTPWLRERLNTSTDLGRSKNELLKDFGASDTFDFTLLDNHWYETSLCALSLGPIAKPERLLSKRRRDGDAPKRRHANANRYSLIGDFQIKNSGDILMSPPDGQWFGNSMDTVERVKKAAIDRVILRATQSVRQVAFEPFWSVENRIRLAEKWIDGRSEKVVMIVAHSLFFDFWIDILQREKRAIWNYSRKTKSPVPINEDGDSRQPGTLWTGGLTSSTSCARPKGMLPNASFIILEWTYGTDIVQNYTRILSRTG